MLPSPFWFPFFSLILRHLFGLSHSLSNVISVSLTFSLAALLYVKIVHLSVSTLVSLFLFFFGPFHNHPSLLFCLSIRQSRQPAVGEAKQRAMCLSQTYSSALPLSHE